VILNKKNNIENITIHYFKLYNATMVKKTNMVPAQKQTWNRIEDPEIKPQCYRHLTLDNGVKNTLFTKWC
jgi:hypothetical protein